MISTLSTIVPLNLKEKVFVAFCRSLAAVLMPGPEGWRTFCPGWKQEQNWFGTSRN
jgi:hypothetical protein